MSAEERLAQAGIFRQHSTPVIPGIGTPALAGEKPIMVQATGFSINMQPVTEFLWTPCIILAESRCSVPLPEATWGTVLLHPGWMLPRCSPEKHFWVLQRDQCLFKEIVFPSQLELQKPFVEQCCESHQQADLG